jgi:endoribonuclease Dicer
MCTLLLKGKFLNSRLLSKYKKLKPEGANAHLAVSEKKTGKYVMKLKPALWEMGRRTVPEMVYLTIIDMKEGLSRKHQPIGLLTRHVLPQFPSFPLFLDSGKLSHVVTAPKPSFPVKDYEVVAFTRYTLLLLYHVNAKKYEDNPPNMSYWVVPIIAGSLEASNSRVCIDWNALDEALEAEHQQWTPEMPANYLVNKFMVDPWAGNRRFWSEWMRPDLKPLDDIPKGTAKYSRPGASKKTNILQYSISLFGKSFDAAWEKADKNQPVIECTQLRYRQNLLAPPTSKEDEASKKSSLSFLCPEPLIISSLSPEIVAMFQVFPPVIHRLEDYLIALEAPKLLGLDIGPALALEAMTKDSDNSDDHATDDRINFRAGMGNNYERLEFMGDCFLKMATSVSLFISKPHDNEFEFHVARMHMICNQNLMNKALDTNLTQYVRSMAFSR